MTVVWSWWASGFALAALMLGHWLLTGRMFAVSGRYTAIVDRVRQGAPVEPTLSDAEMIEAIRVMTAEQLGPDAVTPAGRAPLSEPVVKRALPWTVHLAFLGAVLVGGLASALLPGGPGLLREFGGAAFARIFGGHNGTELLALLVGGLLVGAGTRMAGGCTSGHGLCGVSRFQRGSLVSTFTFFGAGIVVSMVLSRLAA